MRSKPGKVRLKTEPALLRSAGLLLEYHAALGPLDLAEVFGNEHPVEVEIGPGKGGFLLRRAAARTEINFLGVEWVYAYAAYVADRAYRAKQPNVRVLCADAAEFFETSLAADSIWRVHIYFPDPWPKRKHRRRRLIKPPFLQLVRRALRPGGWLGIVTDDDDYFEKIEQVLSTTEGLTRIPFAPCAGAEGMVGSNFENKYGQAGRALHALAAFRSR